MSTAIYTDISDLTRLAVHHDVNGVPQCIEVQVFLGADGVPVVQVDTPLHIGRVRINLNDAPVWDADPERKPHTCTFDGEKTETHSLCDTYGQCDNGV